MNTPQLIVMAAGIGSRYGGLKQIDPIGPNQETILDYSIFDAMRAGFNNVIFVISKEIEPNFRRKIELTIGKYCEVTYVYQALENIPPEFSLPYYRKKPWGTAHAVLSCKNLVDSSFAVINADDYYGPSTYVRLYNFLSQRADDEDKPRYCIVGYILENTLTEHGTVARGICDVDENGWLRSIRERIRIKRFGSDVKYTENGKIWITIPGDSIASMNMWGFTPHIFSELDDRFFLFLQDNRGNLLDVEFFLPEVVNELLLENKASVQVLNTDENWYGITYKSDKPVVKEAIRNYIRGGIYPANLWELADGNQL